MANQSKLKAWVRIDGTGTVVGSGPIFSLKKPKVGKWREMNANLCCNSTPTTTTTTTAGGGGVTPTAWVGFLANIGQSSSWAWNACNQTGGSSLIVYTSTTVDPLPAGTALYSDAALTTLIPYSFGAISINGTVYEVINGYTNPLGGTGTPCIYVTTTSTTTVSPIVSYRIGNTEYASFSEACANSGDINGGTTLYGLGAEYTGGTQLYYDSNLTFPYGGNGWHPSMTQWPSGTTRGMALANGVINAGLPC